jgi:hypothetical protein
MAKLNGASRDAQSVPAEVLLREMSELISLRERVEQAELAAHIYGESVMRRRHAGPPISDQGRLRS